MVFVADKKAGPLAARQQGAQALREGAAPSDRGLSRSLIACKDLRQAIRIAELEKRFGARQFIPYCRRSAILPEGMQRALDPRKPSPVALAVGRAVFQGIINNISKTELVAYRTYGETAKAKTFRRLTDTSRELVTTLTSNDGHQHRLDEKPLLHLAQVLHNAHRIVVGKNAEQLKERGLAFNTNGVKFSPAVILQEIQSLPIELINVDMVGALCLAQEIAQMPEEDFKLMLSLCSRWGSDETVTRNPGGIPVERTRITSDWLHDRQGESIKAFADSRIAEQKIKLDQLVKSYEMALLRRDIDVLFEPASRRVAAVWRPEIGAFDEVLIKLRTVYDARKRLVNACMCTVEARPALGILQCDAKDPVALYSYVTTTFPDIAPRIEWLRQRYITQRELVHRELLAMPVSERELRCSVRLFLGASMDEIIPRVMHMIDVRTVSAIDYRFVKHGGVLQRANFYDSEFWSSHQAEGVVLAHITRNKEGSIVYDLASIGCFPARISAYIPVPDFLRSDSRFSYRELTISDPIHEPDALRRVLGAYTLLMNLAGADYVYTVAHSEGEKTAEVFSHLGAHPKPIDSFIWEIKPGSGDICLLVPKIYPASPLTREEAALLMGDKQR